MKKFYAFLIAAGTAFGSNAQLSNYSAGDVVPDFTVTDLNGQQHSLYEYTSAGKYVLLDFFAYWCGPCMATAPTINEFYHTYGCNAGDVIVLGLEYEGSDEQTHQFEASAGIDDENPYPTASGVNGAAAAVHATYGAAAFPTIVAITPDNVVIDNDIWPIADVNTIINTFPAGSINPMICLVNTAEENANETAVDVYPNPANAFTQVTASVNANLDQVDITIYDQTGRLVSQAKWNNLTIGSNVYRLETTALPAGIYHMNMSENGAIIHTEKIVIAH